MFRFSTHVKLPARLPCHRDEDGLFTRRHRLRGERLKSLTGRSTSDDDMRRNKNNTQKHECVLDEKRAQLTGTAKHSLSLSLFLSPTPPSHPPSFPLSHKRDSSDQVSSLLVRRCSVLVRQTPAALTTIISRLTDRAPKEIDLPNDRHWNAS